MSISLLPDLERRKSRSSARNILPLLSLSPADFKSVWVSTDDKHLCDLVARTFADKHERVHIHMRSNEAASDTATSLHSVKEFLTFTEANINCCCECCVQRKQKQVQLSASVPAVSREEKFIQRKHINITALIQCTSPILHSAHLQSACTFMLANAHTIESIFSACTFGTSLQWQRASCSQKYKPVNFDPYNRPRRQNMNAGEDIQLNSREKVTILHPCFPVLSLLFFSFSFFLSPFCLLFPRPPLMHSYLSCFRIINYRFNLRRVWTLLLLQ